MSQNKIVCIHNPFLFHCYHGKGKCIVLTVNIKYTIGNLAGIVKSQNYTIMVLPSCQVLAIAISIEHIMIQAQLIGNSAKRFLHIFSCWYSLKILRITLIPIRVFLVTLDLSLEIFQSLESLDSNSTVVEE